MCVCVSSLPHRLRGDMYSGATDSKDKTRKQWTQQETLLLLEVGQTQSLIL